LKDSEGAAEAAPWLSRSELAAWRAYIEGSLRLNTKIDDDLRSSSGLTLFDYHVLLLLAEAPRGRLRMGDLAHRLVFAPSRLTYQAARLEQKGLIGRETCEEDARGSFAVITPAGREALRQATAAHAASIRRHLLGALDPADVEDLGRVFARVKAHLEPPGAHPSASEEV
jgi:DNA-binding MarR family transcriptional regulator